MFCSRDRESFVLIPEYGDNRCFVAPWAQGAYLYYPMIIPIIIIVSFASWTFWKIYGFQKDVSFARGSSSKKDRKTLEAQFLSQISTIIL
jgi:hypothetical protein